MAAVRQIHIPPEGTPRVIVSAVHTYTVALQPIDAQNSSEREGPKVAFSIFAVHQASPSALDCSKLPCLPRIPRGLL